MPQSHRDWTAVTINPLIAEQLNYDEEAERADLNTQLLSLNDDQQATYARIANVIDNNEAKLFFLNGPGGTGKTYVYNTICAKVQSEGSIILCVLSSGISALLIRGGQTAHLIFKIPIDTLTESSLCAIPKNSQHANLLHAVKVIIWDKIGAQHLYAVEAVDRTLRDIRDNDRPFGGTITIDGGDFLQTLPVLPKGLREDIVNATI